MDKAIGVIGGVGPYAGIDLVKKIFDHTQATRDQEHIDLYLTSCPSIIPDRTEYLLRGGADPAEGIYACFDKLARMGATVVVIPCNTAHAPAIYDRVYKQALAAFPQVRFLNMIEETCHYIATLFPAGAEIGLMATLGTHGVGLYRDYLSKYPFLHLLEPDEDGRKRVHQAIYDQSFGIKAISPVSQTATDLLLTEARKLVAQGAKALILGCTELPLAIHDGMVDCQLVDPTDTVAKAAVREAAPGKLK